MFCTKCGSKTPNNAAYCSACGSPLTDIAETAEWVSPEPYSSAFSPEVQNQGVPSTKVVVLSIIGLIFAFLFPIVTYVCSVIGLVFASGEIASGKTAKTTYRTMNIAALVIAVLNSILGIILALS